MSNPTFWTFFHSIGTVFQSTCFIWWTVCALLLPCFGLVELTFARDFTFITTWACETHWALCLYIKRVDEVTRFSIVWFALCLSFYLLVWRDRTSYCLAAAVSTWTSLAYWADFTVNQSGFIAECSSKTIVRLLCNMRTFFSNWANDTLIVSSEWIGSLSAHHWQCCTTSTFITGFAFFLLLFSSVNVASSLGIILLANILFLFVLPE